MGKLVIHGNIKVNATVPSGTGDNVLTTDGTTGDIGQIGVIDTATFISTTLPSGQIIVGNGSNAATGVTPSGDVTINNAGVTAIGTGVIVNTDINASAAIDLTKLAATTASRALVTDGSGFIVVSAVTATELGHSSGVTSAIQTQIDSKVSSSTLTTNGDIFYRAGGVVTRLPIGTNGYVLGVTAGLPVWEAKQPVPNGGTTAQYLAKNSNTDGDVSWVTLTAAKITDVTSSAAELNILDGVTATFTELNYVDGVTSNIQTQLDAKQATITGSASTVVSANLTSNRAAIINGSGKFAASATTDTEIGYVSGVTSAIQGQINAKLGTSLAQNSIFVGNGSNQAAAYAAGSNGQVLTISAGVPTWVTPGVGGTVTSIDVSGTGTGMSFTGGPITTTGTISLTGTLDVDNGGTGFASYAIGDLLHATGATTLTKLASVSAGSFLRSAGVTTASTWSTVKLPDTMSALGMWVANSANTVVNLTAAANQSVRVNSGGTAWEAYTPGGITNGAANNELMKSDGTNAVPSGVFSTNAGDLTLGTGLATTLRTITSAGTGSDIYTEYVNKGIGEFTFKQSSASSQGWINGLNQNIDLIRGMATTAGIQHQFLKGRGSIGSYVIVNDGDQIAEISFGGALDSSSFTLSAKIEALVNGTPVASPASIPVDLVFHTGANSIALPTAERFRIKSTGDLVVPEGTLGKVIRTKVTVAGGATLRAIGSAPQTIIAAPGANKYLNIVSVAVSYNYNSAVYNFGGTEIPIFKVTGSATGWKIGTGIINAAADANRTLFVDNTASDWGVDVATNTAFVLTTVDAGDATTGDGDLDVVVYYTIEDTNT